MSKTYKIFLSTNDEHLKLKVKFKTNGATGTAIFKGGSKDEESEIIRLSDNPNWTWESTGLDDQIWRFKKLTDNNNNCKGCNYKHFLKYEVEGTTGPGPGSGTAGNSGP